MQIITTSLNDLPTIVRNFPNFTPIHLELIKDSEFKSIEEYYSSVINSSLLQSFLEGNNEQLILVSPESPMIPSSRLVIATYLEIFYGVSILEMIDTANLSTYINDPNGIKRSMVVFTDDPVLAIERPENLVNEVYTCMINDPTPIYDGKKCEKKVRVIAKTLWPIV